MTATFDPTAVKWEAPPARGRGVEDPNAAAFVAMLMEKPDEWAVYRTDAITGKVSDLRSRKGVQITSRPNVNEAGERDGTSTVWARWVGVDADGETILTDEQIARRAARKANKANKAAAEASEIF